MMLMRQMTLTSAGSDVKSAKTQTIIATEK